MTTRFLRAPALLMFLGGSLVLAANEATFRIVANTYQYFPNGLIEGSPGVFYSEAVGGASGATTVLFSITTGGSKTGLTSFPSGYDVGSLLQSAANGRFYSQVAEDTVAGWVYHVFSIASTPGSVQAYAPQILVPLLTQNLPDGNLLSVAVGLDASPWYVATVGLNGTVTSIYQLPADQKAATAIYASDGNYYGVSLATSTTGGSVFRATPSGSAATLYSFPAGSFGINYPVPLLQATDGNLYGVTPTGGANGTGTIYRLTLSGQYTLLYTFPNDENSPNPTSLIEGSDGSLYGATLGSFKSGHGGQLFRITKSGKYTLLHQMGNPSEHESCGCSLVQGSDGLIYGTAGETIFSLDVGLPKPAPWTQHFSPTSGAVSAQVRLWGNNLLSAAVQFNGVAAATVSNSGSNYVWATVPEGATTGPITVTTPGGTVTTADSFTVK